MCAFYFSCEEMLMLLCKLEDVRFCFSGYVLFCFFYNYRFPMHFSGIHFQYAHFILSDVVFC